MHRTMRSRYSVSDCGAFCCVVPARESAQLNDTSHEGRASCKPGRFAAGCHQGIRAAAVHRRVVLSRAGGADVTFSQRYPKVGKVPSLGAVSFSGLLASGKSATLRADAVIPVRSTANRYIDELFLRSNQLSFVWSARLSRRAPIPASRPRDSSDDARVPRCNLQGFGSRAGNAFDRCISA